MKYWNKNKGTKKFFHLTETEEIFLLFNLFNKRGAELENHYFAGKKNER